MEITSAAFIKSSPDLESCPSPNRPEYAFIGRSNVGKSSLINRMTNKKKLALTSSTPGKTTLINHYDINEQLYWVDLPGYGYARRSKQTIRTMDKLIYGYLRQRENLLTTFLLIDSRHEPQKKDLDFIRWCGMNSISFQIIFTKADKLSKKELDVNIEHYMDKLSEEWEELPGYFITSAEKGWGLSGILKFIRQTSKIFYESKNQDSF